MSWITCPSGVNQWALPLNLLTQLSPVPQKSIRRLIGTIIWTARKFWNIFRVDCLSANTTNFAITGFALAYIHFLKVARHIVSQSQLGPALRWSYLFSWPLFRLHWAENIFLVRFGVLWLEVLHQNANNCPCGSRFSFSFHWFFW